MKTLLLMRHAETEPHARNDVMRRLTAFGEQQARNVGQALSHEDQPDLILVSPAERTKETGVLVAEEAGYKHLEIKEMPLLYQATEETLRCILMTGDENCDSVMIIAHNPGVSHLIESLKIAESANQAILSGFIYPTAGLISLSVHVKHWADFFDHPAEVNFTILK